MNTERFGMTEEEQNLVKNKCGGYLSSCVKKLPARRQFGSFFI